MQVFHPQEISVAAGRLLGSNPRFKSVLIRSAAAHPGASLHACGADRMPCRRGHIKPQLWRGKARFSLQPQCHCVIQSLETKLSQFAVKASGPYRSETGLNQDQRP
jgi:hypothetical protein